MDVCLTTLSVIDQQFSVEACQNEYNHFYKRLNIKSLVVSVTSNIFLYALIKTGRNFRKKTNININVEESEQAVVCCT